MLKTLMLCLVFYLFSASTYGASATVKVTIKIPQAPEATRLYNFKQKSYEIIRSPANLSREEILNYLPQQNPKVTEILDLHIAKGRTPYRALTFVYLYLKNPPRSNHTD
ncbi:hypothetical protein [Kangiella marina]|uniref:Uncharacterized protein n=1 Tax=Kangiella marina TaxID=1079178 RepID=A0ABP8IDN9_9GAMM